MAEFETKIKDLGDKIAGLSLKEAKDLGDYLKDAYGIEPAGGGAIVMAGPAGGGGEAAKPAEKTSFNVVLKSFDAAKKIGLIKVVREITGLGLAEAKALVEGAPKPVKEGLGKDEAEAMKAKLVEAGGTIELA